MNKPADDQYALHELIRDRWSPVAYDGRSISREMLGSLLEAARWAPSSYNEQPWRYVVAMRDEAAEFARLLSCLVDANAAWAKNASVLILAVASLKFSRNGKPNRHAQHDVGLANENLVLQAAALGLAGHQMAGFDPGKCRALYAIPDDFEPLTMIAVGYHATGSDVDETLRRREDSPRSRKPLSEMAFSSQWGKRLFES
jgi:nitroreductase